MKFRMLAAAVIALLTITACCRAGFAESSGNAARSSTALAERYLDDRERELYDSILKKLTAIADGRQEAKTFYLNASTPFSTKKEYEDAMEKVMFLIVNYAPEYNYWIYSHGYTVYDTERCGVIYGISPAYQSPLNKNMVDPDKINEAKKALANAKSIADKYKDKNDFEKVIGYAEEICALCTYNDQASDDEDYFHSDVNPWNVIYTFDGDPKTNIVCGGYAKSLEYICALGGVECHYVTGDNNDGFHAWNIVVIDGENYFVDLTACDVFDEKVIKSSHPMVMNSVISSTEEETATLYTSSGYIMQNVYKYGDSELKYLPGSLRKISTKPYSKGDLGAMFIIVAVIAVGAAVFLVIKRKKRSEDEYY